MGSRPRVDDYEDHVPLRLLELDDVRVVGERLGFPEGPVVLGDGSVAVVELRRGLVTRCGPDGASPIAEVGGKPNGAAVGPDGALYVCNAGPGEAPKKSRPSIQRVDVDSGEVAELYAEVDGEPFVSPNDIVFDREGGFWFTDYGRGAVYYATADGGRIERALEGLLTPNGIGLSPDGTDLYYAETQTRQVLRRRLAEPGRLIPSPGYSIGALITRGEADRDCLVVGLPGGQQLDSLAVEASGRICVGMLLESGVLTVDADGTEGEKHLLPPDVADPAVTNICFGGADMQTAYLTLSLTGRLISCRWPRPGLRLAFQP